ncbi:caspase family protein [Actinoplanes subglobosus]|uniref:Caspase domain-containing protein n=1 Tax=Actinoplanes subglobosus TaxID=1547892 RepID=A0ABV8J066_9ACTN
MTLFDPAKSRAVYVGVSRYEHMPDLPSVEQSTLDLASTMSDAYLGAIPEANSTKLINPPDQQTVGDALESAADFADDMLLFYYAGHGVSGLTRSDLYLSLPGTRPPRPAFNAVQYSLVREVILGSKAAVRVVMLDCCFSGRAALPGLSENLSRVKAELEIAGAYVLTASPANAIALAGETHTAFTGELINLLNEGVPSSEKYLTLDAIYTQLRSRMRRRNWPEPQRLTTASADQLGLVINRSYSADESPRQSIPRPSAQISSERLQFENSRFSALQDRQAKFRKKYGKRDRGVRVRLRRAVNGILGPSGSGRENDCCLVPAGASRRIFMAASSSRPLKTLRCPICGSVINDWSSEIAPRFLWVDEPGGSIIKIDKGQYKTLLERFPDGRLDAMRECTVLHGSDCHSRSSHALPDLYGEYGSPIAIGLIGGIAAGKTLLLAAMINELTNNIDVQRKFGVTPSPLHLRIEREYFRRTVHPFCNLRREASKTLVMQSELTYVLKLDSDYAGRSFAVAFFDLSGEYFYQLDSVRATGFVKGASAFIFVVDPVSATPTLVPPGKGRWPAPSGFAAPVEVLRECRADPGDPFIPAPAAIVVTKGDLIRDADPLIGKWLDREDTLDLKTSSEESKDIYSFLAGRDARPWLYPAEAFMDASLHVASASGVDVLDSGYFPSHGFGQRRVLRPLLSIFAALGIVDRRLLFP